MKKFLIISSACLYSYSCLAINKDGLANLKTESNNPGVTFTENKGQVYDQNFKPRPDVLFSGSLKNLVYHLRKDGISYQLCKIDSWKEKLDPRSLKKTKEIEKGLIYRLDVNWLGINKNVETIPDNALPGYNNYYLHICPNGVNNVRTYNGVTYKKIYHNIDLHYYSKNGNLKYDFIVSPGANYKEIKLQINGATEIRIETDGSVVFKTPLGEIKEDKPKAFQHNRELNATWLLKGNTLSFKIGSYDPKKPLIIDPLVAVRSWGTYYGSSNIDNGYGSATDSLGNVYMCGATQSFNAIATAGAQQVALGYDGINLLPDAFLVKFNTSGSRIWATYYGGTQTEVGNSCAVDKFGNVYLAGQAHASGLNVVATAGSFQQVNGGGWNTYDAFLAKFNANGIRLWGTFYGGAGQDMAYSCTTDKTGNVFISGSTTTSGGTVIATAGSQQDTWGGSNFIGDAFLVKFNGNGVRQWGTYYGGINDDVSYACSTDKFGNVFISGDTQSGTGTVIATVGSHQSSYGGVKDAFLAKFDSTGVRLWATYYGGSQTEGNNCCSVDTTGNVFLGGLTLSFGGTVIATPGSLAPTVPSGGQTYLTKFNGSGIRQWGTYFGGENIFCCSTDKNNNVYISGSSGSSTLVASPGSHQTIFAGGTADAFLSKFDNGGNWTWGTYYGGPQDDYGFSCAADNFGNVYMAGQTTSPAGTVIASANGFQNTYGGGGGPEDAFLVKLFDCNAPNPPVSATPAGNQVICNNHSATLSATGAGTLTWYSSPTSTLVLGAGTLFASPNLTTGLSSSTYTFYAQAYNGCVPSLTRIPITVTVNPSPVINASNPSICPGNSCTLTPSGAVSYTYSSVTPVVSPTITSTYSIVGTSSLGCLSAVKVVTVTVLTPPAVSVAGNNTICAGQSATLSASGAWTYSWSNGSTSSSVVVSPLATQVYTVVGSISCYDTVVVTVNVNALPSIGISSTNSTICVGQSATLTANGANIYAWSTGGNSNVIVVSPTTSTTYSIIGTGINGCSNSSLFTENVDLCTSIGDLKTAGFGSISVFPNPGNGYLNISGNSQNSRLEIEVSDAMGKIIYFSNFESENKLIDIHDKAKGLYFLKVFYNYNLILVRKFILN